MTDWSKHIIQDKEGFCSCYRRREICICLSSHMREHSKTKILWSRQIAVCKQFFTRIEKYLKDNKHNSLYFVQKHTHVFVLGHYLFLKAHSFCQIMSVDKYLWIFSCQIEVIVYIHTYIYILTVLWCVKTNYLWANIFQGL